MKPTDTLVIMLAVILLTGCGKSEEKIAAEKAGSEAAQIEAAKKRMLDALLEELKDPASAQFRNVRVQLRKVSDKHGNKGDSMCGQVNAKNSFGGYTGFQAFYIIQMDGQKPSVFIQSSDILGPVAVSNAKRLGCI